jgi:hypothetical protein
VSYGSNPYRKDKPRWAFSNAMETSEVPGVALRLPLSSGGSADQLLSAEAAGRVAGWTRNTWGLCVSWFIGLPRRAGARLHTGNDAEARWWHWDVTECLAGLGRQYRDARFVALPDNRALRRVELSDGPGGTGAGNLASSPASPLPPALSPARSGSLDFLSPRGPG